MNTLSTPSLLLRLEGLAVLAASCFLYQRCFPGHWGLFALLFLVPDVSLLGYLRGETRLAAGFYNAAHNYVVALVCGAFFPQIALIWIGHIGFDRLMGYGLKYPGSFRRTHIQVVA